MATPNPALCQRSKSRQSRVKPNGHVLSTSSHRQSLGHPAVPSAGGPPFRQARSSGTAEACMAFPRRPAAPRPAAPKPFLGHRCPPRDYAQGDTQRPGVRLETSATTLANRDLGRVPLPWPTLAWGQPPLSCRVRQCQKPPAAPGGRGGGGTKMFASPLKLSHAIDALKKRRQQPTARPSQAPTCQQRPPPRALLSAD